MSSRGADFAIDMRWESTPWLTSDMLESINTPETARNTASAATLLCVFLAAHFAQRVREERPRGFTALSLLALNWAILLLYYIPGAPETEILSSFSGFLLILTGGLLVREAAADELRNTNPPITWLDTLPLFLFRTTVVGFGVYYLVKRLFHWEYGWGTLALALWGTFLSIFGYFAIWIGVVSLYRRRRGAARAAALLGSLLTVYSAAEIGYAVWYARDYWPLYSRYLTLEARPDSPDFRAMLPFRPQPDWPEADRWKRAAEAEVRGTPLSKLLGLRVQPNVPDSWPWLTYLFSLLKIALTAALLILVVRLPPQDSDADLLPLHHWLDKRLHLYRNEPPEGTKEPTAMGPSEKGGPHR